MHQLMSMFGWLTMHEAQRYTQAAERKRLARDAAQTLTGKRGWTETPGQQKCPTLTRLSVPPAAKPLILNRVPD